MIRVELDAGEAQQALARLSGLAGELRPVLAQLGELLAETTKARFRAGTGPDGSAWAPNRPSTILSALMRRAGATVRRRGEHVAQAAPVATSKRPLIGESRRLSSEIAYELGAAEVSIGSSLIYAAAQQLGARRGAFGRTRRGSPIPWGDVPARPFLGLSAEDERGVTETVEEAILTALGA